jgi:uncharacterized protein (TIRG00374 family)
LKNIGSIIKVLLSLGFGVGVIVLFWNAMSEEDKTQTIFAFKRANYFWVILAPVIGFIANFVRTQRWRLLLRPVGYNPNYGNTFYAVMTMYFFNLFVPRLGEVMRCTILAKYEDVPVEKSLGTMVTERLLDVLCLGIIMLLVFLLLGHEHYNLMKVNFKERTAGFGDGAVFEILKYSIPALIVIGGGIFSVIYIKKNGVEKLIILVKEKVKSLLLSIFSIKDVKQKPQFLLLTVSIWLMYLLMTYINFLALPETKDLPVFCALVCLLFGSFAVIMTPGGIGVYPIVIQMVLITFKVNPSVALAIGMIAWAVQTLGMLIGGILSLVLLNLTNRVKR